MRECTRCSVTKTLQTGPLTQRHHLYGIAVPRRHPRARHCPAPTPPPHTALLCPATHAHGIAVTHHPHTRHCRTPTSPTHTALPCPDATHAHGIAVPQRHRPTCTALPCPDVTHTHGIAVPRRHPHTRHCRAPALSPHIVGARHAVPLLRHWPTYTPCRAPTTSLAHLYAMPCPYYVIDPPIRHAVPLLRHWPTYTPCRTPTTSSSHLYAMPCPYKAETGGEGRYHPTTA
jgi:hypothetical protein